MNYIAMASSDAGMVKETNQDSYFAEISSTPIGKVAFAIVCDGMGGLDRGELASASVTEAFRRWTKERLPSLCVQEIPDQEIRQDWTEIALSYNEKLQRYGREHQIRLGTTVTSLLLTESRYYIMNVGDTRAYEITNRILQVTRDHTVIEREIEMGNLTPEEAETDPRRSVLLQCIGASEEIYPDFFFGRPRLNSVYLLCSDGFRHKISNAEIHRHLNADVCASPEEIKRNIDRLIALDMRRMEQDNITAIAIRTY